MTQSTGENHPGQPTDFPESTDNCQFGEVCQAVSGAWPDLTTRPGDVLVGVSGGADSVALACAMVALRRDSAVEGRLVVAHFNHRWRAEVSDEDADWVGQLTEKLDAEFVVESAEESAPTTEEAARDARYEFFARVARRYSSRYVATAHTRDDQIETVLMRVLRGTGVAGLAGIPVTRPLASDVTLIRPLLDVSRKQVEAALRKIGLSWRTDESNTDTSFTRNWLRHELLPKLRVRLPHDVDTAVEQLAGQCRAWADWLGKLAGELAMRHASLTAGETSSIRIDAGTLLSERLIDRELPDILLTEVFRKLWRQVDWPERDMSQAQWQRVLAALRESVVEPFELPGGVRVERDRDYLMLSR